MKRIVVFVLLIGALVLPSLPIYQLPTVRDPGIFSYAGEQILKGKTLYSDVWDHKGPLIYYLHALGIAIGGHSGWGVWILNWLFVASSIIFGYLALRRVFGERAAVFGVWACLIGLSILGGNLNIEEASLPFQFAAVYLYARWRDQDASWGYGVLIGIAAALAFLSRANNVGIHVAIAMLVFFQGIAARRWRKTALVMLSMLLGALVVFSVVAVYFARLNMLADLIDASITYNLSYSNTSAGYRVISFIYGLRRLSIVTPILFVCVILTWLFRNRVGGRSVQQALIALALVDLPIEMFLSTLSGRNYSHYYLSWLPSLSIFTSFLAYLLWNHLEYLKERFHLWALRFSDLLRWSSWNRLLTWLDKMVQSLYKPAVILQGLSVLLLLNVWIVRAPRTMLFFRTNPGQPVIEFIQSNTQPNDYLLMWSAEIGYNYVTGRPSPSRYTNQYPLFTQGYQTKEMVAELLDAIAAKKPLIIDASSTDPLSPPIDDEQRSRWKPNAAKWGLLPEMDQVFAYIHAHYARVGTAGQNGWVAYKFVQ